jgi:hypothetical protein
MDSCFILNADMTFSNLIIIDDKYLIEDTLKMVRSKSKKHPFS